MGDIKKYDFFDSTSIGTMVTALSNASSVQATDLENITNILNQFLKKINSTDNNYTELRNQYFKSTVGKVLLQKVAIAFIYYFAEFVKVRYFKRKVYKNVAQAKTDLLSFFKDITGDESTGQCYKTYLTLLSGNDNLVPARTFDGDVIVAHDLIDSIYHSEICDEVTAERNSPEAWSLTELLDGLEHVDLSKPETIKFDSLMKNLNNKDPMVKFGSALAACFSAAAIANSSSFNVTNELLNNKISILYTAYHNLSKDQQNLINTALKNNKLTNVNLNFSTQDEIKTHKKQLESFIRDLQKANSDKNKNSGVEQGKSGDGSGGQDLKASIEHESEDSDKLNQLAMNMADYMTGRIDAQQFQNRDIEIRYGRPSPQPNEDGEMLLNELED